MRYQLLLKDTLERGLELSPESVHTWSEPARKNVGLGMMYRCTYRELYERVGRLANMVEKLGIKRGDRIGVLSENGHRTTELSFAIPMMGCAYHPLYITQPPEQLAYLSNKGQYKALFVDERLISTAEKIAAEVNVQHYVVMTDRENLPETSLSPVYSYEQLMNEASPEYIFPENLDENEPAVIFNTGGTTGMPKMMMHSHRSIFTHALDICMPADAFGFRDDDVVLIAMPFWYANHWNMHYGAALAGAKMVFPSSMPTGMELGELIEKENVSFAYGTSSHWLSWVSDLDKDKWKFNLTSLDRIAGVINSMAPPLIWKTLYEKSGAQIITTTGFIEGCPLTSMATCRSKNWEEMEKVITKDGKRSVLTKNKVVITIGGRHVKPDGREVGYIGYKGPHIIEEYYDAPEKTAESFDSEGYFYPGDVGTIDADGNICVRGRKEDMIKTAEGLVSPKELEDVINQLDSILECAAVGVPGGEYEKPVVAVVLMEDYKGKVSEEDIRRAYVGKIAEPLIPEVRLIERLPRQAAGKISRPELKKMLSQLYSGASPI